MAGRCVCGRSATFPLCDGSHGGEWGCGGAPRGTVVLGGQHLESAAHRLAHHLGGTLAPPEGGPVGRLVVLMDASDLASMAEQVSRFQAHRVEVLAVDMPAAAVMAHLPHASVRPVMSPNPLQLWRGVLQALGQAGAPEPLASAFVSHAVADEITLLPALSRVRRHAGAELFVCADSIAMGSRWLDTIREALDAAEHFVFVASAASRASTFCAFEVGWAMHAGKPLRCISLDGTPPPAFMADVQAVSVPRHLAARPWLSPEEALVEGVLACLAKAVPGAN